mmetsp:Transcript_18510/g.51848  ORF Transcript_18510/g.51848 Transcript_18510/m.51848 type:complete len:859 (-) Transcript_18510:217-2793(-)|eukprot:CAMPEP_0117660380 /NCGR_PEP_ID=MMETSP0804-20121206/6937_1 /TAXON_ID=1074897 /ORGANISM="Tetraselmis astigmatica, Strain CCMP880" /LENGTH=858 /DNA_ID=CAMNT_0005467105 /DNA_START=53 /DNA_END=2629 /DNA_ORIENTATION=-
MAPFTTLEDSPMLRSQLMGMESKVEGLKERCKLLTKASRKYRDGLMNMHLSEKEFASALETVCVDNDEDLVAMGPFVTVLNQLASFHRTLHTQMEELLVEPLQRWHTFLSDTKELRKKLDKCGLDYEEQRSRYLGMKKKTKQEVVEKQAADLKAARSEFEEARYSMASKLVVVDVRRKYEMVEALTSTMEAHMHFFRRGNDLFTGLEPKIQAAMHDVEQQRALEKEEEVALITMVAAQRLETEAKASASAAAECSSPGGAGAGPLQLTGQAGRRAAEIETLIKASLEGGNTSAIKQGYLYKRSSNMRGDWKQRFFILDSCGTLCYYRNKDAHSATNTVNLLFSTIKPDADDTSMRCCFRVVSPNKTYTLQAENEAEVAQWMESLQAVIAYLIGSTTPEQLQAMLPEPASSAPTPGSTVRHRRNLSGDSDLSVQSDGEFAMVERVGGRERISPLDMSEAGLQASGSGREDAGALAADGPYPPHGCFAFRRPNPYAVASKEPALPFLPNTGAIGDAPKQPPPLEVIRKVEGNGICADCGAADPDWASLSYGITLCIECSGVHRRMGVHISKVRSLTLDVKVWEPSVMQMFTSLGNRFVNSLLESSGPGGQIKQEDSWLWSADSDGEDSEVDPRALERTASIASASGSAALAEAAAEPKPTHMDSLSVKEKYITAKYVDKRFLPKPPAMEKVELELWEAVDNGNVQAALQCILSGAAINKWYSHIHAVRLMSEALEVADELGIPIPTASCASSGSSVLELSLLHAAARNNHVGCMELLLQHGAKPDAPDMYKRSPLHYCMLFQTNEAAKLLLRKGAAADSTDMSNCTPLDTAMKRGRLTDEELFVMLSDADALEPNKRSYI